MESGSWASSLPHPLADLTASWPLSPELGPYPTIAIAVCAAVALASFIKLSPRDSEKFPTINPQTGFEILGKARRQDYAQHSASYVSQGQQRFPGKPFKLMADFGELMVLPPSYAHEIRNEPNLIFMKALHEDFHADFAPFKAFASGTSDDALLQSVARKHLTKYLNKVTKPLSDETTFALNEHFGSPSDWQELALKSALLSIVARMSSRVFLGEQLCRNEEWLEVTKNYTTTAVLAAEELRCYPKWYRGIAQLYLPGCRKSLALIERSRELIGAVLEERRKAISQGQYKPAHSDAIDWFEEEAGGRPYDPAMCQLMMSVAAIHTTTDLCNETLLNLAVRPELVNEIRQEIIEVLRADGWKKTSLYNLKLLDSVLKESQRLGQPPLRMNRKAVGDVKLPEGTTLQKGERTAISTSGMVDPQVYENPLEFDGHRFVRYRDQEGLQNQAHLVSTGPNAIGFGHGKHACPGRFFASNELKVLLCHFLMKYEFKLPEGYVPKDRITGVIRVSDAASRLLMKRRQPEIDLDELEG